MNENFVAVDLDNICHNLQAVAKHTGTAVCGVIKADAYGHGAVPVAKAIAPYCRFLAISSIEEAIEIRNAGITLPLLLLGHTSQEDFPQMVEMEIRPAIFTVADGTAFSQEAVRQGKTGYIHFAVDTGMHRIGFPVTEEAVADCVTIAGLPNIKIEGVFSHFATADEKDLTRTQKQAERFEDFCQALAEKGVNPEIRHLNNSAASIRRQSHYDMVRAGIVLYGARPGDDVDVSALELRPALSWYSKIAHIQWLDAGEEISYGGTFTTVRPTRVATLPVGYGHGYPRNLSNCFYVLIRGKRAPILGRVCMDQMMVDITDIPEASLEDLAVLVGKSDNEIITAEALSQQAGSFAYEFLCTLARRVPRFYYQNGQLLEKRNYLTD